MLRPSFIFTLLLVGVTFLGCYLCVLDDQAGLRSLHLLGPGLLDLSDIGGLFVQKALDTIPRVIPIICFGLALVGLRRRSSDSNLFFLALIVGVASEYFLIIQKSGKIGSAGYVLAFLLVFLANKKSSRLDPILDEVQDRDRLSGFDALLLGGISMLALVFRMYALNHNVNYFEGELSPYSAAATSLPGMLVANRGHGAWAPLGILYYLPIYVTTKLFGTTLLALRLSSSIVGIFTIPFLYLFARRVAGKEAGLMAALFLTLNNQHIGWGRTDIHPHGVTTWPAVLLCLVFLRACERKKISDFILVMLAMGLTWHQYPSGQSAVIIPILATGIYWLLNGFRLPFRWHHSVWLGLGVVLWFIGLPLSYWYPIGEFRVGNPFNLTGPRALWGGLENKTGTFERALAVVTSTLVHLWDVVKGIFYKAWYIFHQDSLSEVYGMEPRTVPWLLLPFVFVAMVMLVRTAYRIEVAVLLSWIVAAILPGILSEQAYPKRLSTLFPALDMVAAIGIVIALTYIRRGNQAWRRVLSTTALSLAFFGYTAFESRQWFSGIKPRYGEPPEIKAVKELSKDITSGSLVIAELSTGYYTGKISYLLLDHLTAPESRPNLWFIPQRPFIREYIQNPMKALDFKETWAYECTKLREQVEETATVTDWKRVVFVLQDKPANEDPKSAGDIELAKGRCNNPKVRVIPSEGTFWVPLVVVVCEMGDLK